MIIIVVEHFLNQEGENYFPSWIESVRNTLQHWPGFIDIYQLYPADRSGNCLLLRFKTLRQLRAWSSSKDHDGAIKLLHPYRFRKQQSQVYELGAEQD